MPERIAALMLAAAISAAPSAATADVTDELFAATILFEQAHLGAARLDGGAVRAGTRATLGASLRLELLLGQWIGLGVEGSASYFRFSGPIGIDSEPDVIIDGVLNSDFHLITGTNGFLRLRFGLANGRAEYYFIGGAGPAVLIHDENDPNFYGAGVTGTSELGWTAYGRFGIRGELVPGFGGLVEIGYIHREHADAFERTTEGGTQRFDYVTNQLSVTFGWYVSR